MPSPKTECTELSVGFGLLAKEPIGLSPAEVERLFEGTLPLEKYSDFEREFYSREKFYRRFYGIGLSVRNSYARFGPLTSVRWEGPLQQAKSVSVAKDLVAANTPISVKDGSHIVANRSPYILFLSLPRGTRPPRRSKNWFFDLSPDLYQAYYSLISNRSRDLTLPEKVEDFHKIPKTQRKNFSILAEQLSKSGDGECQELYLALCHDISKKSAEMFNRELAVSTLNAVAEDIIRTFFRIGEVEYILCGLDKGLDFAVTMPDLTTWRRDWTVKGLTAVPDLKAGQSQVWFDMVVMQKRTRQCHNLRFRAEIRWAHRKFSTPEAKLYKAFSWTDVPFFSQIYDNKVVEKLMIIGSGGFGTVYKGILRRTGEVVAIKELSPLEQAANEGASVARKRFEREVTIQSELSHPNILPILASDLRGRTPWFAAPLALCSVETILAELPSNFERLERIFWQVLHAIHYAHNQNVVHRDLKPDNILLFDGDRVMVSDFGLGKNRSAEDSGGPVTRSSDNAWGTLPYSAPEQFSDFRNADFRSDIYALGMTLASMFLGEEPDFEFEVASIDERYRGFIRRCIAPDPEDRFQSMEEVIAAFAEITGSDSTAEVSQGLLF